LLSSEYGWTTEYILERTLHEINWRLACINKRLNNNREFEMAIRGIKPEGSEEVSNSEKKVSLTEDQKTAMDIARKKAIERKRLEFMER
jgi:hypothetical protein